MIRKRTYEANTSEGSQGSENSRVLATTTRSVKRMDRRQHGRALSVESDTSTGSSVGEIWVIVEDMTLDFFEELKMLYEIMDTELCVQSICHESQPISELLARIKFQLSKQQELFPALEAAASALINSQEGTVTESTDSAYVQWRECMAIIYRGLLRVYVHLYQYHYGQFGALGAAQHLTTCCKRVFDFASQQDLLPVAELAQIQQGIVALMQQNQAQHVRA